jgi:3-mercaptopyruvate sulfurtransferase SseA
MRKKKETLLILVAGLALLSVILAACSASTPQAEPTNPGFPASPEASPIVAPPQEVQRVTLEESKAAFDSKAALFLDVRSADSYTTGHIPGALLIPLAELEARINELDPNQWIITYCT